MTLPRRTAGSVLTRSRRTDTSTTPASGRTRYVVDPSTVRPDVRGAAVAGTGNAGTAIARHTTNQIWRPTPRLQPPTGTVEPIRTPPALRRSPRPPARRPRPHLDAASVPLVRGAEPWA